MVDKLAIEGGRPVRNKPFPIWPHATALGRNYVDEVVRSNGWGIFRGSRITEFGQKFAKYHGAKYGIPCSNATTALEVQLKSIGVGKGDEVITTVYSCISTITSIMIVGAIPVFVDVDERGCIDPRLIEEKITKKTKVIMPVHLYDSLCDLDALSKLARKHKLFLVEDSAQMPGSFWRKHGVGTVGISGSFSFQEAKVMTAGEGGIILTNNREVAEVAQSYINCGRVPDGSRTRRRVLGSNGRMTELQAALLLAQLKDLHKNTLLRMRNARRLTNGIKSLPGIKAYLPPTHATKQAYYFYTFRLIENEAGISRDLFIKALNAEGIPTRNTFVPLYRDPLFHLNKFDAPAAYNYFKTHKPLAKNFPMAEQLSSEIVAFWHPILLGSNSDIDDVIRAIKKVLTRAESLSRIEV